MKLLNFLKKQLPDGKLALCVALPYTKELFFDCIKRNSDFIDSIQLKYKTSDDELLWIHYKQTAEEIQSTIDELRSRNVFVTDLTSIEDFASAFNDYENVVVIAHRHRNLFSLDFMGNTVAVDDVVAAIPQDFKGIIDFSSCYSEEFMLRAKCRAPEANIISAGTLSDVSLRLFLYRNVAKHMANNPKVCYLEALRHITEMILREAQASAGRKNTFLGGDVGDNSINSMVNASAFAPAQAQKGDFFFVQVYFYKHNECDIVSALAQNADSEAEQKSRANMLLKLESGDKIDVEMRVMGLPEVAASKSIIWQDNYTKVTFGVEVPTGFDKSRMMVEVLVSVNGAMLGELSFVVDIVSSPDLNEIAGVTSKSFKKMFISYSHKDAEKVKKLPDACDIAGIKVFFDRDYLKPGDIFPLEIENFINTADIFVLCWSKNAAESEYVNKEIALALQRAYPNKPLEEALRFCPYNLEPKAEIPSNLSNYHFGEFPL